MQETQKMRVWSLDQEDPLEKEIATHSSILAWEIPWTEDPGRIQTMGSQKSWTELKWLSMHASVTQVDPISKSLAKFHLQKVYFPDAFQKMWNKFTFTGTRRHIFLKGHHSNHYTDYGKSSDHVTWAAPNELDVIWPTICKTGNVQQQPSNLKWHIRVRLQHEQAAHSFNTHFWCTASSVSIHIYAMSEVPYNQVTWAWLCDVGAQARSSWMLHFSPS